jgi:hypothetical protein
MLHRTENMHFFLKVCNDIKLGGFKFRLYRAPGSLKVHTLRLIVCELKWFKVVKLLPEVVLGCRGYRHTDSKMIS